MVGVCIALATVLCGACGQSNCAASCVSSWTLDFDSPIGQPGKYEFTVGSTNCSVELPAISSSCAIIRDFSVIGFASSSWTSARPSRQMHVAITKDGTKVLDGDALIESYAEHSMCGETCASASFHMSVPAELAPTVRPACDLAKLTGTYAVVESGHSGGCSSVFSDATVVVSNGELVPTDPSCQSQLTAWSPDTCRAESTTTCASGTLNVTWNLTLTDLLTDGSKLVGIGSVTMLGPVACEAAANLQLTR